MSGQEFPTVGKRSAQIGGVAHNTVPNHVRKRSTNSAFKLRLSITSEHKTEKFDL